MEHSIPEHHTCVAPAAIIKEKNDVEKGDGRKIEPELENAGNTSPK